MNLGPEVIVTHKGVPVGRTRLTNGELAVGELRASSGYDAIHSIVRPASASLWAAVMAQSAGPASPGRLDAIARAAALELELRDEAGALLHTDFVNVIERPLEMQPPLVVARFRLAPAPKPAVIEPAPLASPSERDD
jgi:hypothetical protein